MLNWDGFLCSVEFIARVKVEQKQLRSQSSLFLKRWDGKEKSAGNEVRTKAKVNSVMSWLKIEIKLKIVVYAGK